MAALEMSLVNKTLPRLSYFPYLASLWTYVQLSYMSTTMSLSSPSPAPILPVSSPYLRKVIKNTYC